MDTLYRLCLNTRKAGRGRLAKFLPGTKLLRQKVRDYR